MNIGPTMKEDKEWKKQRHQNGANSRKIPPIMVDWKKDDLTDVINDLMNKNSQEHLAKMPEGQLLKSASNLREKITCGKKEFWALELTNKMTKIDEYQYLIWPVNDLNDPTNNLKEIKNENTEYQSR